MADVAFHVGKRTSASRAFRFIWIGTLAIATALSSTAASAQNMQPPTGEKGLAATLSYGGRLYDNHWAVLNLLPPRQPNNRNPVPLLVSLHHLPPDARQWRMIKSRSNDIARFCSPARWASLNVLEYDMTFGSRHRMWPDVTHPFA